MAKILGLPPAVFWIGLLALAVVGYGTGLGSHGFKLDVTAAPQSVANPMLPSGEVCKIEAGQTRATSVTMTGVILEQEGYTLGTPVYSGFIDGTFYTAQAGGTAVTQDKGSPFSVILYNASNVVHPVYAEGKIPCGSDNYAIINAGSIKNSLAPVGGLTMTLYNDDGITANSGTNQTMGASYTGLLRIRMQGNSTYGNSKGYFTNPQINKVAVMINALPTTSGSTTATTLDMSKTTFSINGVACTAYAGQSTYATTNLYSKVFQCQASLTSGIPQDAYLGVQAVSGQNPTGYLQVIVVPFEYFSGKAGITTGFENDNGALTGVGSAAGSVATYSIT